ncbi:MAG: hypothetical protein ABIP68_02035 [Ferruginibacter sp.]
MGELQLYFDGKLFMGMQIELPEYSPDMPFKTRVTLRQWFVKSKVEEMKVMYHRQISKMQYNYEFYLLVQSTKVNKSMSVNFYEIGDE